MATDPILTDSCSVRVRGIVQGVGFRPFVYRLARANTLAGWVLNADDGVEIHLEGPQEGLQAFVRGLREHAPPAAKISTIDVAPAHPTGLRDFTIRESSGRDHPTVRISPDLSVCDSCLAELLDPRDARFGYPYINCTDCGPRYSIIQSIPYDRARTTMRDWEMDERCARDFEDPNNRRFHAQPLACPACGPHHLLRCNDVTTRGDGDVIRQAVALLVDGRILAIKGLGGYHLACDAGNASAVLALRERKFRKEKPFALMVKNLDVARTLVDLSASAEAVLTGSARPIVLAPARREMAGVAPENDELGIMLPYTPLHHLLFGSGAPDVMVMTSANRSNEPIAYEDQDATQRLTGIADAFLIGERPIARCVEDSVVRVAEHGPTMLRRSRGYAPGAVTTLPLDRPVLALGADLKNAITLVVDGQAFVSQYVGDLEDYASFRAFEETIADLLMMYRVPREELLVVRDGHPQYRSSMHAETLEAGELRAVQHHRAHVASVLAERQAWDTRVLGLSLDGTGYGDDGTIWGGEFFVGALADGLEHVARFRRSALVGGDAAARHPVQAAAGFLDQIGELPDLRAEPFRFPARYRECVTLLRAGTRVFVTSSAGRLFDAAAALLGFTRPVTFEGQAAIWLEHLAVRSPTVEPYAFPWTGEELDFRPLLHAVAWDRARGRDRAEIARAFHSGIAHGLCAASHSLCAAHDVHTIVASGGVFQNALLVAEVRSLVTDRGYTLWTNNAVPPNDGGISLGQAACAAFGRFDEPSSPGS